MAQIPPFKTDSETAAQVWWDMFEQKVETKLRMAKTMAEKFWPTKDWNDLSDAQYEMLTHYCNVIMFETTESVRQRVEVGTPEYEELL